MKWARSPAPSPPLKPLTKGIAAIAGFKGAGALEEMVEKKDEAKADGAEAAPEDGAAPQA